MDLISIATNFVGFVPGTIKFMRRWWSFRRPASKVLEGFLDNDVSAKVFIKDLMVPDNTLRAPKLFSVEGSFQQANPNIGIVWPEVEARGLAEVFNMLGQLDKYQNINVIPMSEGYEDWQGNILVLGAQAMKCREFYRTMDEVGYGVDEERIYNVETSETIVAPDQEYGYGVIIKARNNNSSSHAAPAFLLGGFGTLGTEAAIHYFSSHIADLGKEFGNDCFSIIVRVRLGSGRQTVRRMMEHTIRFHR